MFDLEHHAVPKSTPLSAVRASRGGPSAPPMARNGGQVPTPTAIPAGWAATAGAWPEPAWKLSAAGCLGWVGRRGARPALQHVMLYGLLTLIAFRPQAAARDLSSW